MLVSRRNFVKSAAMLTAGYGLFNGIEGCAGSQGKQGKYGIQLYTLRDLVIKDVRSTLQFLAKTGYSQIEVYGFGENGFFGFSPTNFRQLFNEFGLTTPSGHYSLPSNFATGNMDGWKKCIEASVTMGNQFIVMPWMEPKLRNPEDWQRVLEFLHRAVDLSKNAGLQLAYHNHEFEFVKNANGTSMMDDLLNHFTANELQIELDLYWTVFAGHNPIDYFNKYPGRFPLWHVKDLTQNDQGSKTTTQVGSGTIPFGDYFDLRQKAGLKHAYVEQEHFTMPVEQCVGMSIDYMKKHHWGNR